MKKCIYFLMLMVSITGIAHAQENQSVTNEDRIFDLPVNEINRRFLISLDKGDKMQVELVGIKDLSRVGNIDSLLKVFLKDLAPLKDSLSDELTVKRIDYVMEPPAAKKIRIRQSRPAGTSYLVQHDDVAALKLEQDTVHFIGVVPVPGMKTVHRYRISFFINRLEDLNTYTNGHLQERLVSLKNNVNTNWVKDDKGMMHIQKDYTISSKLTGGSLSSHGDYVVLSPSVSIQNYKNYFVPSFSLGATFMVGSMSSRSKIREFGAYWEPNFFFGKDANGKLKTYRNDFLTLVYGVGPGKKEENRKEPYLQYVFSLGYLIHRSGDYFEEHSFRLGMGRMSLFEGKTKLEPVLYFHEFFKGVTPGIRLIQSF